MFTRQAKDSVRIYGKRGSYILNSKSEFNHPPTARVVVDFFSMSQIIMRYKIKSIICKNIQSIERKNLEENTSHEILNLFFISKCAIGHDTKVFF